jgi:hypothetical protein
MRKVQIALILVLLPCFLPRIRHFFVSGDLVDFGPYYTAATIARAHQGIGIYNGADTGGDPQNVLAAPSTPFAETARRIGVLRPFLYLYPPTLADMLIPITLFPFTTAGKIWTVINYATLPLISLLIIRLLKLKVMSWVSLTILIALFSFSPVLQCIAVGQVSILLLLLWTCGIFCFTKGWHGAAGFAFALAAAIKLTPAIVIVPLLLWKEWRVLWAMLFSWLGMAVTISLVNTPSSLTDYFGHVVPPMSRGVLAINNMSISASVTRLYAALLNQTISPAVVDHVPAVVVVLGKVCAAGIMGAAGLLIYNRRGGTKQLDDVMVLALFAMLSVCIAPVTWGHAYSTCFLTLSLLWADALRARVSNVYLTMLLLCTVASTTYMNKYAYSSAGTHPVLAALVLSIAPVAGSVMVLSKLAAMRSAPDAPRYQLEPKLQPLPL